MTTTVQQRNGFGSRLFSWGKEFGPVWPLFLRSRKGATRTVRAAAAQAACDPRGRKPHLWSCGPQIVVHRKLPENELHACKEWPQVAQTSDSQVRTCGVFHKKKKELAGFQVPELHKGHGMVLQWQTFEFKSLLLWPPRPTRDSLCPNRTGVTESIFLPNGL